MSSLADRRHHDKKLAIRADYDQRRTAALIDAAPELLRVLKECQRRCWQGARNRRDDPLLHEVKAAIAKAEGRECFTVKARFGHV